MKRIMFVLSAAAMLASSAQAQQVSPQCPPGTTNSAGQPDNNRIAQDACQKSIDIFQYMAPQLALVLTGGDVSLGAPAADGRPGHFSLGIRATGLNGTVPLIDRIVPSTNGAQQSTYETKSQLLGMPTADLSVGVFPGVTLGNGSSFGSLDVLASATYLRGVDAGTISVSLPGSSWKFGAGARVGLIAESSTLPGVSLSYLRRGNPPLDLTAASGSDVLRVQNLSIQTNAWRATVTKRFWLLRVAGGVGHDSYHSSALISAKVAPRTTPIVVAGGTAGPVSLLQTLSRTNIFGEAVLGLGPLKIAAEIGRVSGGEIVTYNRFTGTQPADSRVYGSAGIRLGR